MVETNEKLIKEVYEELHHEKPTEFIYATYKAEDGMTFIHVALNESEGEVLWPIYLHLKSFRRVSKNGARNRPWPVILRK